MYLSDQSAKIFRTNWSEIMKHFFGKNTYNEMKFLPGWLGWIWNCIPTSPGSPFSPAGPTGPLGENGDPWEVGLQFHIHPRHPCKNYPFKSEFKNTAKKTDTYQLNFLPFSSPRWSYSQICFWKIFILSNCLLQQSSLKILKSWHKNLNLFWVKLLVYRSVNVTMNNSNSTTWNSPLLSNVNNWENNSIDFFLVS